MTYTVRQFNYQNSLNADNMNVDAQLNAMEEEGWELVTSDVGSFPYVTTLWHKSAAKSSKDADADMHRGGKSS